MTSLVEFCSFFHNQHFFPRAFILLNYICLQKKNKKKKTLVLVNTVRPFA